MQFTLSYNDTVKLIDTEYTDLFSTYYSNWISDIDSIYDSLSKLDIYNAKIVNHRTLNKSGTRVEVTYSNNNVYIIDYETETLESRVI